MDTPQHFICTGGCEGVSPTPGTCQAVSCAKHGHPLTECNCTDSKHHKEENKEEDKEEIL